MDMQLTPFKHKYLRELMGWFSTSQSIIDWAGPGFRYPFDETSFYGDLTANHERSFVLLNDKHTLLAFGQTYLRENKCHLARLVVNPAHRGMGLAQILVEALCKQGVETFNVTACSLFVYPHNVQAISAYKKIGFSKAEYPIGANNGSPLTKCFYMIK